jgi:hypothetical protein
MGNREGKGLLGNSDLELDAFKREIDLRQFAVSLGYGIDRRESWRGSTVLRRGGDKIVVKRNGNGHYLFFSVRDDNDHGTIIDFVKGRQNLNLGAVRKVLRPWIGRPATPTRIPALEPTNSDRMRVERAYRGTADVSRYPYLEQDRCLPAAVCGSTPAETRCSRISTPPGCAATKSRIADSPALPQGAKRDCGSRIHGATTGA